MSIAAPCSGAGLRSALGPGTWLEPPSERTDVPAPVRLEHLTAAAFAPFGTLLDLPAGEPGRFDRQATLSDLRDGLAPNLALIRTAAVPPPTRIERLERHPYSSQLFAPLGMAGRFLVVVAPNSADDRPDLALLRAFLCEGARAVVYAPNVWHHPLVSLVPCRFLMLVHEDGSADDTEWHDLAAPLPLDPTPP